MINKNDPIEIVDKNISNNFYNQFKPIDEILVKPLVKFSYVLMKRLYFKSDIIGFITLFCFTLASYFSYQNKDNLTYVFVFFAFFISFFDNLYDNNLNEKQQNKEMLLVLIKLTLHTIINMMIKLYVSKDNSCNAIKRNLYMLLFFLIIIIMLIHHTEKIYKKRKIVSKKLSYIKKINIFLFIITCLSIFLFSYNYIVDDIKDPLDIFILNDNKSN
jgi:hypothetical protein